jgi:predicted dehydrogenase
VKEHFPDAHYYADYRQFLKDEGIDAVSIATEAGTHFRIAREFLENGKHAFVEKPLALSVMECRELCRIAGERNLILMTGHVFLYSPAVRKLKELYENGELGELYYLYSQRLNLGRVRNDVEVVWNFTPHDVSIIMYLFNENVVSVSARGIEVLQGGKCDVAFIHMVTKSGKNIHVHVSWIDPNKVRTMTLVGSRKMAVYDDTCPDRKIQVFDKGIVKSPLDATFGEFSDFGSFQYLLRAGDIVIPKIDSTEPLYNECLHFLKCISEGEHPLSDGEHGMRVVEVLEAISKSIGKKGEWIQIAANKM